MEGFGREKADKLMETASVLGKSVIISQVQSILAPKVVEIFSDHGHEELKRMILTDYDLVMEHTPEGLRKTLKRVGPTRELRLQFENMVVESIQPENVLFWLKNPEEWLEDDEAEEQREELRKCAEVIETTDGGQEWLVRQVEDVYKIAGIIPEDTRIAESND